MERDFFVKVAKKKKEEKQGIMFQEFSIFYGFLIFRNRGRGSWILVYNMQKKVDIS